MFTLTIVDSFKAFSTPFTLFVSSAFFWSSSSFPPVIVTENQFISRRFGWKCRYLVVFLTTDILGVVVMMLVVVVMRYTLWMKAVMKHTRDWYTAFQGGINGLHSRCFIHRCILLLSSWTHTSHSHKHFQKSNFNNILIIRMIVHLGFPHNLMVLLINL